MEEFCILIFVSFFATNSLDKAESVELVETPHKIFDEIFGWWNYDKAEEWHKLTLEHNFHHQIDGQNTQLGQIETNSTDQNPPLTESDHSGQIGPNSTDQNPPLTESNHYGQIKPNSTDQNLRLTKSDQSDNANGEEQNEIMKKITSNKNIVEDERKRKIIDKFHAIKEEFKQKRKYSYKERTRIEIKIAKHLKVNRTKIYKWKKEFGISRKVFNEKEERKHLIVKFDQMKDDLKRAGFKNSYRHEIDETVAKELGLTFVTIYKWKSELGQTIAQRKNSHSKHMELLMKHYYEIKDKNSKISDEKIAKMLKIGTSTLFRWKKQFNKREKFHPNSVDGHSVEENVGSDVMEI